MRQWVCAFQVRKPGERTRVHSAYPRRSENRGRYLWVALKAGVNTPESPSKKGEKLTSRGFRITVDEGRESFFAICIEEEGSDTAWIMSDTVVTPEEMR